MLGSLRLDIRHALRSLARAPAMTGAAIACVALGIGAITAIYAAVHTALVQPLPLPAADEMVVVYRTTPQFASGPFAPANFLDLRRETESLQHLAAVSRGTALLRHADETEQVAATRVSGGFFPATGVQPVMGRLLRLSDEDPGEAPAAVISEELWRDRYDADAGIIGRTLYLDGDEYTVVGVAPADFRVPQGNRIFTADVWTPLRFGPDEATFRRSNSLLLVGRLAEGRSVEAAHSELRAIMDRIIEQYPVLEGEQLRVLPLQQEAVASVRTPLLMLLGAVGFVLLIAVANVASLLLARGVARRREWAVRTAMGAGNSDVMRSAVVESLMVTGAGAMLGLLLAFAGVRLIATLVPGRIPQLQDLSLDPMVVVVGLAVAAIVGLLAGLAPAWQAQRTAPRGALYSSRGGASRGHHRFLRILVTAEVALSLILLVGAGLVIRGFADLVDRDPGFDPEPLLTLNIQVPPENYADVSISEGFLEPAIEAIRSVPGVEDAAHTHVIPYQSWGWNRNMRYEGQPGDDPTRLPLAETRYVTPSYFETLDIDLLEGRLFQTSDARDDAPLVVVANRALAEEHLPDEDAVGKRFHLSDTVFATIVGVVENTRNVGPARPPAPEIYFTVQQAGVRSTALPMIIRTAGDPAQHAEAVAEAIRDVEPGAAVYRVSTMEDIMDASVARPKFYLALLGLFAAVALALAMAGLYGVMSYAVAQRTREIGIRAALGSTPAKSLGTVLKGGLAMVGPGVGIGLFGAWAVTGLLEWLLYGVSPLDPVAWAAATLALVGVGVLAILVPANRAARVDPMEAIRIE